MCHESPRPVRSHRFGPLWWHRLSVRLGYLPLDIVLVHGKVPEPSPIPSRVAAVVVPVGVYEVRGQKTGDREATRRAWGVRGSQKVFLAFGHVRDEKNLDLSIRGLPANPEAFFVMAGELVADGNRPFSSYRALAVQLGVADRCYFQERFISDAEVGSFFDGDPTL